MNRDIFEDLFVLEMTNNHLGKLERGLKIITDHARIARFNNVRAGIKFQFRDVDSFVHKDHRTRTDIRYIKRTLETKMSVADYEKMVETTRKNNCIPMCTPFDEKSVDMCVELGIQILKIASSSMNDWFLVEKIAKTKKPVIVSAGGISEKDLDDLVTFFDNRHIPLAINHCVSIYPSEDYELDLNQIDYLRHRYPNHTIGLSTHEHKDWTASVMMAYAKGARTFERHVDVEMDGMPVTPYTSLPHQIDSWFKAFKKAKEMCGGSTEQRRIFPEKELKHLNTFLRGVYAKRDLPKGHVLKHEDLEKDVYLAIPLLKGQISCRELMSGEILLTPVKKDQPVMIDNIDGPYAYNEDLKKSIYERGI